MEEVKRKRGRPKKKDSLSDSLFIRISSSDKAKLRLLSAKTGLSLMEYCRVVLLSSDDNHEDFYDFYDEGEYDEDYEYDDF